MPAQSEEVFGRLVHVDFVKFVPVTATGEENLDNPPRIGYLIHHDDRQEFGYRTFRSSDSYTLEYDVYHWVYRQHPAFVDAIREHGGFYLNGKWQEVNQEGEFIHE
jgi:hypothetical protein